MPWAAMLGANSESEHRSSLKLHRFKFNFQASSASHPVIGTWLSSNRMVPPAGSNISGVVGHANHETKRLPLKYSLRESNRLLRAPSLPFA